MADTHIREQGGVVMALGANVRPRDPAEDKYHFLRTTRPVRTVDLNQPRLLSRVRASDGAEHDYRVAIKDQGSLGSCAAFAACTCAEMCSALVGRPYVNLHAGWLYEQVRITENTFPADSGSYPADNLDAAMAGVPPLADYQYVQDASFRYPDSMTQDRAADDYVASHRPFYPNDGGVLDNVWTALDQEMPIELGMDWLSEFFQPARGVLPPGLSGASSAGGHAITIWGIVPGYLLCANQWSAGWAADAPQSGLPDMRPGDFAIPWEYATRKEPLLWEYRAVSPEPVIPQPQPGPQPTPQGCQAAATALADQVISTYDAALAIHPRSTRARYGKQGAQAVRQQLTGLPQ